MLVLSRKAQEKIRIGDDITITIIKVKGKTVRVGIEAPAATPVLRGELTFEDDAQQRPSPVARQSKSATPVSPVREAWPSDQTPCVSHTRAPRNRVASVLPAMLGDAAPLRDMLHRRGAAQNV